MGLACAMRDRRGAAARRLLPVGLLAAALLAAMAIRWGSRAAPARPAPQNEAAQSALGENERPRPATSAPPATAPPVTPGPVAPIDLSGLPNFHKVSDDLYRGAQPGYKGFRELKRMGVKTVVGLRWTTTDRRAAEGFGLVYEHLPIHDLHADPGHALSVLRIATNKARCPVFVYCLNGADRTGFVCAAYRVVVCGWSKEDALREMTDSRFGVGVDFGKLPARIREMNVEAIRKRLGLAP